MEHFIVENIDKVEAGEYTVAVRDLRLDSTLETAFINFKMFEGKEVPSATYKISHPTGRSLLMAALNILGFKVGTEIAWDEPIPVNASVKIKVTENGEWLNTSILRG